MFNGLFKNCTFFSKYNNPTQSKQALKILPRYQYNILKYKDSPVDPTMGMNTNKMALFLRA